MLPNACSRENIDHVLILSIKGIVCRIGRLFGLIGEMPQTKFDRILIRRPVECLHRADSFRRVREFCKDELLRLANKRCIVERLRWRCRHVIDSQFFLGRTSDPSDDERLSLLLFAIGCCTISASSCQICFCHKCEKLFALIIRQESLHKNNHQPLAARIVWLRGLFRSPVARVFQLLLGSCNDKEYSELMRLSIDRIKDSREVRIQRIGLCVTWHNN